MAPADARNQRANGIIEPNDDNTWTARHETVNSSISLLLPPSLSIYIYRVTRVIFTILQLSKQPNSYERYFGCFVHFCTLHTFCTFVLV